MRCSDCSDCSRVSSCRLCSDACQSIELLVNARIQFFKGACATLRLQYASQKLWYSTCSNTVLHRSGHAHSMSRSRWHLASGVAAVRGVISACNARAARTAVAIVDKTAVRHATGLTRCGTSKGVSGAGATGVIGSTAADGAVGAASRLASWRLDQQAEQGGRSAGVRAQRGRGHGSRSAQQHRKGGHSQVGSCLHGGGEGGREGGVSVRRKCTGGVVAIGMYAGLSAASVSHTNDVSTWRCRLTLSQKLLD